MVKMTVRHERMWLRPLPPFWSVEVPVSNRNTKSKCHNAIIPAGPDTPKKTLPKNINGCFSNTRSMGIEKSLRMMPAPESVSVM